MVRQNEDMFYLFCLLILLLWVIKGIRRKYRPRPSKTLPLSRRQIEAVVYRRLLSHQIALCILIPLMMILLHWVGRMRLISAIAASLFMLLVPAWNIYVLMYLQWRPVHSVPNEFWIRLEREMSGEILQYLNGGWQFCNWCWYIRVSNHECILLRAELIDFEKPVRHRALSISSMGFKHSVTIHSHEYTFTCKDGSSIRARMEQTPHITQWVKNHGGRFE